ncbi:MAG TPA: hypothetical protein VMQ93_17205 [Novosphingobium sp.]|nr:hypothetical protein [Novosphingobium sp.]
MTKKVILRPATRQMQVVTVDRVANQDMSAGAKILDVADDFDPSSALVNWTALTIGVDTAVIEARLTAAVKKEAERRKMLSFTAGNGKAQEYVQKGKEAAASAGLLATVLNALTAASAAAQYPMAHAERVLTGDTLYNVLASYRAGKAASDAELARLSGIERKSVLAIKAATTAAAKQSAYASINWTQTV